MLFWKALFSFLILPGVGAFAAPLLLARFDPWRQSGTWLGLFPLAVGILGLLWCVRDFYVAGKGTLSPWNPPQQLVVVGLYHACRNPMYVNVLILLAGWTLWFGSPAIAAYAILLGIAFHLRVVLYEEPTLLHLFGSQWEAYRARVPRWLPRWPGVNRSASAE